MNVASLELCKELYELSGWSDTYFMWGNDDGSNNRVLKNDLYMGVDYLAPAYDCGYLLRKLPSYISVELQKRVEYEERWSWNCVAQSPDGFYWLEDGFLEDVLCKLAIELFKQGVLEKAVV